MSEKNNLDGTRILVVDDEPDVLETLEEILGMCRVDTALTYEKALELLEKNDYDAAVLILHVISEKRAEELNRIPGNPWELILEREDRQMIRDFSACLLGDFAKGIPLETRVEVGGVADRIVAVAQEKDADMIVMCTHGGSGLLSSLMGGVAERVLRRASCPVFSVKPKEAESTPF